ncbi:MAG TPA: DUF1552 domain-containing protein [Vicinamibacterales bacterium]|jgi:hypothetical protein|nr:DUF1552 domain-containing protein [Vicinamibacterales bacterium]
MNIGHKLVSRRRVLRGMMRGAVVTVSLPYLDCFLNANGTALAATGETLPAVYGTWYWGLGLNPGRWEPKSSGAITELGLETAPLDRFKDKINIYSGMKVHLDGRPAITHFSGNMATLTGTTPRSNSVVLPTIDTLVADDIGSTTRFKSLEMVSTGNPKHMYSFRSGGVFQPGEASPAAMYVRLFGPEFKDPNASDFTPDPKVMARQSVLSAVKDERRTLERALGSSDRARLDEYFASLRQLEQQLAMQLEKPAPLEACTIPAAPPDGPVGTEIDVVTANHKIFAQLAAHALACGQTNVVNLTFSDMTSSLRRMGSQMIHHVYTHEEPVDPSVGCQPNVAYFITRAMEGLADFLDALASIKEGDKTLLDRSLILAVTDTGYAKVHSYENIPLITAGSAGGRMKTGIHVAGKGDPVSRVGLTIQQALGMPLQDWGTDAMATTKTITEVVA